MGMLTSLARFVDRSTKSIACGVLHPVCEASAAKIWQVGFVPGKWNIADCLTKILSGTALEKQVEMWMWRR